MKTRTKNLAIALFSIVMVFATVFGILSFDYERVSASGTPTVTMLSGASVRKTENEPGIKFTAKIENFVAGNNYQYGMLILPEGRIVDYSKELLSYYSVLNSEYI